MSSSPSSSDGMGRTTALNDLSASAGPPARGSAGWRILVATDGSACAVQAQEFLTRLPFSPGTAIHVVGVAANPFLAAGAYSEVGFASWQVDQELLEAEQTFLTAATKDAEIRLSREGWQITRKVLVGDVSHQIVLAAEQFQADIALVGTKGLRGIDRFLLGSTAQNVARHSPCPVLVARGPRKDVARIILAVDGSHHAAQGVEFIARLPLPPAAEVVVVHVARPYRPIVERLEVLTGSRAVLEPRIEAGRRQQQALADQLVGAACRQLQDAGKSAIPITLIGHPTEEILKLTDDQHADLLVAGARGVSLIPGLLVGSVADSLLQHAPCSVLIVR